MSGDSQAVHYGASLSSVVLLLPFVHLSDEFEEGAFGDGSVAVHRPAQKLELLHHPIPVLRLRHKTHVHDAEADSRAMLASVYSPAPRYRCGRSC